MNKIPRQDTLTIFEGYPKKISERWMRNKDRKSKGDCSIYTQKESCELNEHCYFDSLNKTSRIN